MRMLSRIDQEDRKVRASLRPRTRTCLKSVLLTVLVCDLYGVLHAAGPSQKQNDVAGKAAVTADWTADAPGVRHKITIDDLPPPYETKSVDNGPRLVEQPAGAQLRVPAGFKVEPYASGFDYPRFLLTAPNGDIFVTESHADQIKVLRAAGDGKRRAAQSLPKRD